jgi:DNA (cytosine-5)-methyltransferase 1
MKPRLLDLFCGAGGASMGYHGAGFEVVGIDIKPQPHYPFEFHQADALTYPLDGFDVIHASPPCQRYSRIGCVHGVRENYPDLLEETRNKLLSSGRPWIIENVPDSKLKNSFTLCGSTFDLKAIGAIDGICRQLRRHRLFQSNILIMTNTCRHEGEPIGVYGRGGPQRATRNRGYMGGKRERIEAMGIDWMDAAELSNAIPPAYTEFIGKQLLIYMEEK